MKAGHWFRFGRDEADASVAEIHIIDFIGDWWADAANRSWGENIGVTARAFVEELSRLPDNVKTIRVHINSPGGDVQAGVNIANALREQASKGRTVETFVDGIAASIASVIAMAGSRVVMADNALMMIHDPWGITMGNARELRKHADVLDAMRDGQIVSSYKWHATIDDAEIVALMAAETWMTADEALARGFATEKVEGLKAAASLSKAAFAKLTIPDAYKARVEALIAPEPAPATEPVFDALPIVTACSKAGLPELAEGFVAAKTALDQVRARLGEETQRRAEAAQRATDIRAVCTLAKLPELAEGYIAGGMPLSGVKAQLTVIAAKLDKVEIDGSLSPGQIAPGPRVLSRAAAYRNFNQTPA